MAVRAERSFFFGVLSTALEPGRFVDLDLEGVFSFGGTPTAVDLFSAAALGVAFLRRGLERGLVVGMLA